MRAIIVNKSGGSASLEISDVAEPKIQPESVLVRVSLSGINFIDVYQRSGLYPIPLPFHAGVEAIGVITALGDGVSDLAIGQRVGWFSGGQGSFGEVVLVQADRVVPIPNDVEDKIAISLLMQGTTAHYLAMGAYQVTKGTTALVHAAAGGVGLLLTQILKHLGATVFATASTSEKLDLAKKAGADHLLNYENFADQIRSLTNGRGVDVVFDGVGAATSEGSLNSLCVRGTLVFFGNSSGPVPPLDVTRLAGLGSLYITRPTIAHYTRTADELRARTNDLFNWLKAGVLKVQEPTTFALEDIQIAFDALESRVTTGKLVLEH